MSDFFEKPQEQIDEPQTIKLGEKEYSEDELNRLVGLGQIASEAEEKYKTKIDRVWPEFTKATQRESDYKRQIEELQAKVNQPQPTTQVSGELTAEQKAEVIRQLDALGVGPKAVEERQRQIVREELAAKDLISDVDYLLTEAKDNGNPQTTREELLQHMAETGIKNPAKAYKDMFEAELDAIKEKKLAEIKPNGMVTTTGSKAGSKLPSEVKTTKDNLKQLLAEAIGG